MGGTKIIIVHGPPACGKTRNRSGLAQKLGCNAVVDDVSLRNPDDIAMICRRARQASPLLVLSNMVPATLPRDLSTARVMTFADAMTK